MYCGRFEERTAQRIGHHHCASARRLHQTGNPQAGVTAQLQRVTPLVVQATQHAVHGLQALHGLEVEMIVAHHQVGAFHQGQSQVAGKVSVFEVGLVVGPGREQHDARRGTVRQITRGSVNGVHQAPITRRNVLHTQLAKGIGELP